MNMLLFHQRRGDWTIPAIDYPYFDPQTESYQVARTVPITINVLPNPNGVVGTTSSTHDTIRHTPSQAGHSIYQAGFA